MASKGRGLFLISIGLRFVSAPRLQGGRPPHRTRPRGVHSRMLGCPTWRHEVTTVLCTCRVADFEAFRPGYDKALEMFADQIRSWRLWRNQDDPNVVVIEETFDSRGGRRGALDASGNQSCHGGRRNRHDLCSNRLPRRGRIERALGVSARAVSRRIRVNRCRTGVGLRGQERRFAGRF